jgi:hypothetical protein
MLGDSLKQSLYILVASTKACKDSLLSKLELDLPVAGITWLSTMFDTEYF